VASLNSGIIQLYAAVASLNRGIIEQACMWKKCLLWHLFHYASFICYGALHRRREQKFCISFFVFIFNRLPHIKQTDENAISTRRYNDCDEHIYKQLKQH